MSHLLVIPVLVYSSEVVFVEFETHVGRYNNELSRYIYNISFGDNLHYAMQTIFHNI